MRPMISNRPSCKSFRYSMHVLFLTIITCLCAFQGIAGETNGWRAGVAKAEITPKESMWLAGYANRTNPATGTETPLWIKFLALEDAEGHRALIMTSDTLGIPQGIYQHSCAALKEKFNLAPEQIILSASHTHCGPVLKNSLYDAYPLDDQQLKLIDDYSTWLEKEIVQTAG